MKYSRFNILSKIRDSDRYYIVNLLSGSADILNAEEYLRIEELKQGTGWETDDFTRDLSEKGYLAEAEEEESLWRQKYLDFLDSRESDEIQIFFVTNYSCNFSCSYCYQDQYSNPDGGLTEEIIDSFFRYVVSEFSGRRKYITVFGGEPLMNGDRQKGLISYFVDKANENSLDLSIVTNGYHLAGYIDVLRKGRIREIQVTLDGTREIHDKRRYLHGGGSTFDKIVDGIDLFISEGITVNLRMVADRDNIGNLPELAAFAIEKGWTKSHFFKTQIGRNYELHHCQSAPGVLFDRLSLYEAIYELIKLHPHITEFHKPAYSVARFLSENGELPDPLFDSCPACKTEWAFDYTGRIYSCTATVGKAGEELGTFFPF
ncbi:MAG: radical SAM protein, partial [Bacteroidales bacterium]|nr:radical SAM protein [Bacteroidales bacterium]